MARIPPQSKNQPSVSEQVGGLPKRAPKAVDKKINARVNRLLGEVNRAFEESALRQVFGVGKDKIIAEHEDLSKVYMLPQASFLGRCRRNIVKEVKFILGIKDKLPPENTKNLAVNIDPTNARARIWTTDKAEGNLEKKMRNEDCRQNCKQFCQDIVRGMKNLHKAGYVHGDMKLENMLLIKDFDTKQHYIKVSDFGKGAKVDGDKPSGVYSGNTRYGPPEGRTSKAGDVYGAAICLIRILEEQFLDDTTTSLMSVHKTRKKDPPAHEERRGIEKYILEEPAFTRSYEQKGSFKGKVLDFCARLRTIRGIDKNTLSFEQDAMNRYIDVLTSKLKDSKGLTNEQASFLNLMLKQMTSIDPAARPTMDVVNGALEAIFEEKKQSA